MSVRQCKVRNCWEKTRFGGKYFWIELSFGCAKWLVRKMKLLLGLAALSVCSVSATPTPQLVGPLSSVGNFFQNTFQGFPRPPFFQNGFAFAPFRPQTQQVLIPPQQVAPTPQIIPAQENAQGFNVPIRQISNNGWYWQNWIPLPVIPQYPADQSPTIIIISHPAKPQTAANPTATANSVQSTNNSAVVPNTNESTNNTTLPTPVPAPASNSSESSLPTVAQSSGENLIHLFWKILVN